MCFHEKGKKKVRFQLYPLVGGRIGKLGRRNTNLTVGRVEHGVEPLEPAKAICGP